MERWRNPIPFKLIVTGDSESFRDMPEGSTGLPISPHPGAFEAVRKFDVHEGVDLYVPEGTPVYAVEDGTVTWIEIFTGPNANPPTPWWEETHAVTVNGATSGLSVLYGEIKPVATVEGGWKAVKAGDLIGHVVRVLRKDKGRPMSMLHFEVFDLEANCLVDPVPYLRDCE